MGKYLVILGLLMGGLVIFILSKQDQLEKDWQHIVIRKANACIGVQRNSPKNDYPENWPSTKEAALAFMKEVVEKNEFQYLSSLQWDAKRFEFSP